MREGRTMSVENPPCAFHYGDNDANDANKNVFKKRLMKGESTQSGSSRWVALGLILSMTACKSLTDADNRLPVQPVVGLNVNQFIGGSFDTAGQAFTQSSAHTLYGYHTSTGTTISPSTGPRNAV